MPFQIARNDITRMAVDAIVNAANERLQMGGGVCGSIFKAAGIQELQQACNAIGYCATGNAVITGGYRLPAKHIIHTVGPVWKGGVHGEAMQLERCYTSSLYLAKAQGCESVAFPLISSGIFGYPKEEALRIAVNAIKAFLQTDDLMVYLVVFDRASFAIDEERFHSIQSYIDDRYTDSYTVLSEKRGAPFRPVVMEEAADLAVPAPAMAPSLKQQPRRLEDVISQLDESFSQMLLRLIDEKGRTDVETYKRANIDRKLFSKIRGNPAYNPSKATAIAFAIALELSLDETRDLLSKAGYALSRSHKFDVIIEYFIENNIYNIFEINEALFAFDQMLLGA